MGRCVTPLRISACNGGWNAHIAILAIDEAEKRGYLRDNLRWRMSSAQRIASIDFGLMLKSLDNPEPMNVRELETGSALQRGTFLGIPYLTDNSIPDDEIYLESCTYEIIGSVVHLALPYGYGYPIKEEKTTS